MTTSFLRSILPFMALTLTLCTLSCKEKEKPEEIYEISFAPGQSGKVTLTDAGIKEMSIKLKTRARKEMLEVSQSDPQQWATLIVKKADELLLTAAPNETASERSVSFTIATGRKTFSPRITLIVTQSAMEKYNLALADPKDATVTLQQSGEMKYTVKLTTTAPKEKIELLTPSEASWLTATMESAEALTLSASPNETTEDRTTTVTLKTKGAELQVKVTQEGKDAPGRTLSISCPDIPEQWGSYSYMGDNSQKEIAITVTTDARHWQAKTANMVGEGDGSDWIILKNRSGKSGELLSFHLTPNTTEMRSGTITISAGDAPEITIYVNQMPGEVDATEYKLYTDQSHTKPYANGTTLTVKAKYDTPRDRSIRMYPVTNGGIIVKVCTPGTTTAVEESTAWLTGSGNKEILNIHVKQDNATGKERKLDVVILSTGGKELFRIPVVQPA